MFLLVLSIEKILYSLPNNFFDLLKPLPPTNLILQAWLVFDHIFLHLLRFELHSFSQTFFVRIAKRQTNNLKKCRKHSQMSKANNHFTVSLKQNSSFTTKFRLFRFFLHEQVNCLLNKNHLLKLFVFAPWTHTLLPFSLYHPLSLSHSYFLSLSFLLLSLFHKHQNTVSLSSNASIYLSIYLFIYFSFSLSQPLSLSIDLSISPSLSLFIYLSLFFSFTIYLSIYMFMSIWLFLLAHYLFSHFFSLTLSLTAKNSRILCFNVSLLSLEPFLYLLVSQKR